MVERFLFAMKYDAYDDETYVREIADEHGAWVRYSDYEALRQQVEKARAQGRDEGLEKASKAVREIFFRVIEPRKGAFPRNLVAQWLDDLARTLKSGEGV